MGKLDDWFSRPREEVVKSTMRAAKGYMAEKTQVLSGGQFAHPEYMEHAELLAEQIKEGKKEEDE
jgi:hypothetical protein